jgi:hypothetical protein
MVKNKAARPVPAIVLTICSIGILFSSCVSTRLSNLWRDPAYSFGPMKSMIVISINKDPAKRRQWEDAFALELTKYHVAATPSYRFFPDELPDTSLIVEAVRQYGADGVLIISKLPTQAVDVIVQPSVTTSPVVLYDSSRNRYETRHVEKTNPGYIGTSKIVSREVNVWLTKGRQQLVWSGTCVTPDPISSKKVHDETIGLVVNELANVGVISRK